MSGGGDLSADRTMSLDINGITEESTINDADTLVIYDDSTSAIKKITRANLLEGIGGLTYQGLWNVVSNSPVLADGTGTAGKYYVVEIPATRDLGSGNILFTAGDWVVHNGTTWEKLDTSNDVQSVFGRTNVITAATSDYDADQIDNTAAGNIVATDVQSAINELDTEKQATHAYLTDISGITGTQGDILYFNGTNWVDLAPGTSGQFLQTQGVGANPSWKGTGGLTYQGLWNVVSNSPVLADGTGTLGQYYVVGTPATRNLGSGDISFTAGDWVVHNGTTWDKLDSSNDVQSVFGRTDAITAATGDYDANQIDNTAAGTIVATDVQSAINELDTEKQVAHAYLTDIAGITGTQGDILYFNGTNWVDLAPGTAGQFLQTQGADANPSWDSVVEDNLASTLAFDDGDYLDLSAILHDDIVLQGLRLPQIGSAPSNPISGEGFLGWDQTNKALEYFNGTTWITINDSSRLMRADNGTLETATSEVEYISPDQHGGYFGTVYRKYHGAKVSGNTIPITGITKLLEYSGRYNNIGNYNGYTDQGSDSIRMLKATNKIDIIIVGTMPINEGWVDYVK